MAQIIGATQLVPTPFLLCISLKIWGISSEKHLEMSAAIVLKARKIFPVLMAEFASLSRGSVLNQSFAIIVAAPEQNKLGIPFTWACKMKSPEMSEKNELRPAHRGSRSLASCSTVSREDGHHVVGFCPQTVKNVQKAQKSSTR